MANKTIDFDAFLEDLAKTGVVDVEKIDRSVSTPETRKRESLMKAVGVVEEKPALKAEVQVDSKSVVEDFAPAEEYVEEEGVEELVAEETDEPDHSRMMELCDKAITAMDDLKAVFMEIKKGWKKDLDADKDLGHGE